MVVIVVPIYECGHDILDHNNFKDLTFCLKCNCEKFKEVKINE